MIDRIIKDGIELLVKDRVDNNIHVSNLIEFCPREFIIMKRSGYPYNQGTKIFPGLALTFKIGDAIHTIIQDALRKAGVLILAEGKLGHPVTKDISVTGSCDAIIRLNLDPKFRVVEIKSIGGTAFKELKEPMQKHVRQLTGYLWLLKKMDKGKVGQDYGYVVYVSKEHSNNPIKTFLVPIDTEFEALIENKLAQVKKASKKRSKLPERICSHRGNLMAKKCKCADICLKEMQ